MPFPLDDSSLQTLNTTGLEWQGPPGPSYSGSKWPEPADSGHIKERTGTKKGVKSKRKVAEDRQPAGIS